MKDFHSLLKKVVLNVKRILTRDQRYGLSLINTSRSLKNFWPNTSGSYRKLSQIALKEVNQVIPFINSFGGGHPWSIVD